MSSHSCIISGPTVNGRRAFALRLARSFVCSDANEKPCNRCSDCRKAESGVHPDIISVDLEPDKREITVDRIRAIRADAAVMPNEAAKKVYIIYNADLMNRQAQNAFLKTLEEPPAHAIFLLEAENPSLLLPTVRSRCSSVYALSSPESEDVTPRASEFFNTLSRCGGTEMMRLLFSLEKLEKSDFAAYLSEVRTAASVSLRGGDTFGLSDVRLMQILRLLDTADKYLEANVGTGHIVGLFMSELVPRLKK